MLSASRHFRLLCTVIFTITGALNAIARDLEVECAQQNWQSCHSIGWSAQGSGDFAKAEKFYKKSCQGNLAKSCNNLAWLYDQQQRHQESQEFLTNACQLKHQQACMHLGQRFRRQGDEGSATKYFALACQFGNDQGCLAFKQREPLASPSDKPMQKCHAKANFQECLTEAKALIDKASLKPAITLLRKPCEHGFEDSCVHLGIAFELLRDWDEAVKAYTFACDQGSGESCLRLANFFDSEKMHDEGQEFFKKACDIGERLGCLRLVNGRSNSSQPQLSIEKMTSKCRSDRSAYHCIAAAKHYEKKGQLNQAIEFYEVACSAEEPFGCVSAANVYHRLERNDKAESLVREACKIAYPADCNTFRNNACHQGYGWNCSVHSH